MLHPAIALEQVAQELPLLYDPLGQLQELVPLQVAPLGHDVQVLDVFKKKPDLQVEQLVVFEHVLQLAIQALHELPLLKYPLLQFQLLVPLQLALFGHTVQLLLPNLFVPFK